MVLDYRKNDLEEQMLMNLHKQGWAMGLTTQKYEDHQTSNEDTIKTMLNLSKEYNERVQEEDGKTAQELAVANVGKIDPKRHLENHVADLMASNIVQSLGTMLSTVVF